jgi:hypothetical protein
MRASQSISLPEEEEDELLQSISSSSLLMTINSGAATGEGSITATGTPPAMTTSNGHNGAEVDEEDTDEDHDDEPSDDDEAINHRELEEELELGKG